jgi:xanthine dehydrogenase accessory factor
MDDVLSALLQCWSSGGTAALATVVQTWDSAPRPPGAAMLVTADGAVVGSVSGGCVESDVYEVAREVIISGVPVLRRYGVSDTDALSVGLSCGGTLEVFIERVSAAGAPELADLAADLRAGAPVAVATVVDHVDPDRVGRRLLIHPGPTPLLGSLGSARADAAVADDVRGLLANGQSESLVYGPDGQRRGEGMRIFAASHAAHPRMLVFGAIDYAAALARLAAFVGYAVTVCDARPLFATPARFPDAAEVVIDWPHRYLRVEIDAGRVDSRTVICVLTHDPKFDVPLLAVALQHPVGYVGAMGSRRTHDQRMDRLREAGLGDEQLARLSSPIGLDLGARTPEETAVSIMAEVIASRWGGRGEPLSALQGRIHSDHRVADRTRSPHPST